MSELKKSQKLRVRQQKAITALLSCMTISEAARTSGVSERTIYRWLNEKEFRLHLSSQESQMVNTAARRLIGMAEEALRTIHRLLLDEEISPSVRLRTAEVVLTNMLRLRELVALEERVAELEEQDDPSKTH